MLTKGLVMGAIRQRTLKDYGKLEMSKVVKSVKIGSPKIIESKSGTRRSSMVHSSIKAKEPLRDDTNWRIPEQLEVPLIG